jgi:hypothetical protein
MKRVGVLVGREKTFPEAIINGIHERGRGEIIAEYSSSTVSSTTTRRGTTS